jgi:hypothetical protein
MMKATGKNLTIKWWKRQKIAVQPLDRLRERVSVAAHETARFLLFSLFFRVEESCREAEQGKLANTPLSSSS